MLLIVAGFTAIAVVQRANDLRRFEESHALVIARAIAWADAEANLREDEAAGEQTLRFVEALPRVLPAVREALVLKGTKFVAHTDPARAGKRLDRDSLEDKALFDTFNRLKAAVAKSTETESGRPPLEVEVRRLTTASSTLARTAGVDLIEGTAPAIAEGKLESIARVALTAPKLNAPLPAKLYLAALVALAIFAALAFAGKRPLYLAGGTALLALLSWQATGTLAEWRQELRTAAAISDGEALGVLAKAGLLNAAAPDRKHTLASALDRTPLGASANLLVAVRSSTPAATNPAGGEETKTSTAGATRAGAANAAGATSTDAANAASTTSASGAANAAAAGATLRVDVSPYEVHYRLATLEAETATDRANLSYWAVALAVLAAAFFMLGERGSLARATGSVTRHAFAYAYLSPAMIGMFVLVFIPVAFGIALGFTERRYNTFEFVGLANYVEILTDFDFSDTANFYFKLGVTLLWTFTNIVLHVSIGLFIALMLNDSMMKARGIFRVILILPWAMPSYITALIWKGLFHRQFGVINIFLGAMGVEPVAWFQSFWPAFFANVATNTWLGFPFMMVVSLGALQSIPTDLYEAAFVDGASRWQRFSKITLPLLMPALVPAIIVGTVWTFNMFNVIYLVSAGAPDGATDILITDAFRWAFERDRYGYAAAYSTIILIILLVFTLITNKLTGATKGAFD